MENTVQGIPPHRPCPDAADADARPDPKISVITVVFNNREGFLRTAASVVAQTGAHWEWIVIDGGSKDGTVEAIRTHANRIAYWCSERDGGIYDAMNKGLARASGDFLVFMNSGDRFAGPKALEAVSAAIGAANPDIGMVLGAVRFELTPTYSFVQSPRPLDPYVFHSLPTSHQAMFFRTALHRTTPFDPRIRIAADYDAICRMYKVNSKAAYVPEVVSVVWRGLDSNSIRFPFANMRDMASVQRRILGMGHTRVLASAVRRAMPQVAFRLMSSRYTAPLMKPLISMLRPQARTSVGELG